VKRLFHFACAVLLLSSVSVLHGSEPRRTLWKYLLFFNDGYRGTLAEFRECFVPEERERIFTLPRQQPGVSNDDLEILEELKSSFRSEYRYRLGPDDSVYVLVLEKRNGKWLVNSALTGELQQRQLQQADRAPEKVSSGQESAESRKTPPVPPSAPQPEQYRVPSRSEPPQNAVPASWRKGPNPDWLVHYETALQLARQTGKNIYILKTGSDWCGWCKKLNAEVLQSREFRSFARENLVLVYLDSPKRNPLPADQAQYNQNALKKAGFAAGGGYPTAIVQDSNGREIGRRPGYKPLGEYMKWLSEVTCAPAAKSANEQGEGKSWMRNRNTRTTVQHRNGSVRLVNQKRSAPGPVEPGKDPLANLNLPPMSSRWQRGISGWEVHYPTALTKARQENKMIFALNTGSDWCGWCVKLKKEVLLSSEFKRFARRYLILVYLDSPKKKPLPPDQKQHNMMVRQKLGFGGGVPSAVIVNADGQVVARKSGYSPLSAYMVFLKQQVK